MRHSIGGAQAMAHGCHASHASRRPARHESHDPLATWQGGFLGPSWRERTNQGLAAEKKKKLLWMLMLPFVCSDCSVCLSHRSNFYDQTNVRGVETNARVVGS
ncbi:hypothetical protein N8I77_000023 [Diaporthe amygdali]|uniref:Uncharacterized protein n=1 Tax=Phomopsis amygdali TaxID=1214568 RepID=A0AAD9SNQ9_PHOAM|nr:hypothetical protein N8I77_000023 [Diaporthe amygdali]